MNKMRLWVILPSITFCFILSGCEESHMSVSQQSGGGVYRSQQTDDGETEASKKEDTTHEDMSAKSEFD
ncbi:MAG: hypothetical protein RIM99_01990 [Cyclobacteriaceae bacterium]